VVRELVGKLSDEDVLGEGGKVAELALALAGTEAVRPQLKLDGGTGRCLRGKQL